MVFKFKAYDIINIVTVLTVTMFFSCRNDFEDVQKIGILENQPIGEAEKIDLKYTEFKEDTVRLVANLLSPKMLDYSNRNFSFTEFPDGIKLKIFDDQNQMTTITSRYAIYYTDTDLIDLRGNVIIATHDGDTLYTEQLYYNEELEWMFTNDPWLLKSPGSPLHGVGFDSDRAFKNFQMLEMGGDFQIETIEN